MKVYHFTSAKHAIDDIERQRLKVSRFSELNDPFELLAADLLDPRHLEAFARFKQEVNEKAGIICFSGAWSSPLFALRFSLMRLLDVLLMAIKC